MADASAKDTTAPALGSQAAPAASGEAGAADPKPAAPASTPAPLERSVYDEVRRLAMRVDALEAPAGEITKPLEEAADAVLDAVTTTTKPKGRKASALDGFTIL